jgi:HK97 family phage major capsid protein
MRNGPAKAEPNLAIINPLTWSAVRRSKDSLGRYLATSDPTSPEAQTIWGVPVLVTTQLAAGHGVLLDTSKFGRVYYRDGLTIQMGYAGDDFTSNIIRFVADERFNLAVERPSAVLHITGLPTT